MGMKAGFMEYDRYNVEEVSEKDRVKNFSEFHKKMPKDKVKEQAARCMDCGVPFCQSGMMIRGMTSGCPLHNLIPEINELVYRGNLKEAYNRLSITHSFPEFTCKVCPALCEAACTCSVYNESITVKDNERTVIEYAFDNNLVTEEKPEVRTDKKVAVIGSGPAGLTAAKLLNKRGHNVTVYERSDRAGGLLRYGIPNMKLDKSVIDRRINLMEQAGITFKYNANVGENVSAKELQNEYDAVVLACGASNPRDINVAGRDAKGIYFAVDFLGKVTKTLLDSDFKDVPYDMAKDKNVVVIGGGDTGNDCVGTAIRLGAKSVTQVEMMPKPSEQRLESNPWPEWPKVLKTDYGQKEAIYKFGQDPRVYNTTVKEFIKDKNGNLTGVELVSLQWKKDKKTGRMTMEEVEGSNRKIDADLVLIAAGFLGSQKYVCDAFNVELDARTNVATECDKHLSSVENVYVAGDMRKGQSLVVWAIAEGTAVAGEVDKALMGYTNLVEE